MEDGKSTKLEKKVKPNRAGERKLKDWEDRERTGGKG